MLLASTGAAQTPPPAPTDVDDDAAAPSRPVPRDDRSGTISAFVGGNIVVPGGDLGGGLTLAQVANAGPSAEGGLELGISRYSGLQLRGQFVSFTSSGECAECQLRSIGIGLGLTYHASQALGFDPWVRFGGGYRAMILSGPLTSIQSIVPNEGTFHAVDVGSFSIGGDFFPIPQFGIGLYLEGDVGVQVSTPSADARGAVYGLFQVGLRIALTPQRKSVSVARSQTTLGSASHEPSNFGPSLYNRAAR